MCKGCWGGGDVHEEHDSHKDASELAQEEEGGGGGYQTLIGLEWCDGQIQRQGGETQSGGQGEGNAEPVIPENSIDNRIPANIDNRIHATHGSKPYSLNYLLPEPQNFCSVYVSRMSVSKECISSKRFAPLMESSFKDPHLFPGNRIKNPSNHHYEGKDSRFEPGRKISFIGRELGNERCPKQRRWVASRGIWVASRAGIVGAAGIDIGMGRGVWVGEGGLPKETSQDVTAVGGGGAGCNGGLPVGLVAEDGSEVTCSNTVDGDIRHNKHGRLKAYHTGIIRWVLRPHIHRVFSRAGSAVLDCRRLGT
jgi:hypothetical protein